MKRILIIITLLLSLTVSAQKYLDKQEFVCGFATLKGKINNFDTTYFSVLNEDIDAKKDFSSLLVSSSNPFIGDGVHCSISSDGSFEVKVPMVLKHQIAHISNFLLRLSDDVLLTQGAEVIINYTQNNWGKITPSFSGVNVDINEALEQYPIEEDFLKKMVIGKYEMMANLSPDEFKKYVLDGYKDLAKHIDSLPVTNRAKEILQVQLKGMTGSMLGHLSRYTYLRSNDASPTKITKDYLKYPKILKLNDIMMFCYSGFSDLIDFWKIKVDAMAHYTNIDENRNKCLIDNFGKGDNYFRDFITLYPIFKKLEYDIEFIPDSDVIILEKMSNPFYAEYYKQKKKEKVDSEIQRGGYFAHKKNENKAESDFVELIKDFKGKVLFVNIWNSASIECSRAIESIGRISPIYEGKDVVFLYLSESYTPDDDLNMIFASETDIVKTAGSFNITVSNFLMDWIRYQWNLYEDPSFFIIGKDGLIKDFHTGFKDVEYYKTKIEEELKK